MLNPKLFKALEDIFGEVGIMKEDEPFSTSRKPGLDGKPKTFKESGGEE